MENVKYCWGNKSLVCNFSFCGFLHNIGDFSRAVVASIERPYFISILFYSFGGKANNASNVQIISGAKFPSFLSCHLNFDQNGITTKISNLCFNVTIFVLISLAIFKTSLQKRESLR